MTKIFLSSAESVTVSDSNVSVFGATGTEAVVVLGSGVTGLALDQNVERVQLAWPSTNYRYLHAGNQLKVYHADGATLLATISVQGDSDGTQLTFANGTASAKLSGGVMTLGDAVVGSAAPGPLTLPTLLGSDIPELGTQAFSVVAGTPVATEGDNAIFIVTLSGPRYFVSTINYTLSGTGGAVLGTDTGLPTISGTGITASSNTLTFAPGSTTAFITVPVTADTFSETGEGIKLDLSSPGFGAGLSLTKPTSASVSLTEAGGSISSAMELSLVGVPTGAGQATPSAVDFV
jgi:hypothetical protein